MEGVKGMILIPFLIGAVLILSAVATTRYSKIFIFSTKEALQKIVFPNIAFPNLHPNYVQSVSYTHLTLPTIYSV